MTDRSAKDGIETPSLLDAVLPCAALIVLLGLSYFLFGNNASSGPNQIALLFCGAIAAGIAYKNGMPWYGIRQAVVDGIAIGLPATMILLAVGALIGTWALSGTIITMVYYGLKLLSPAYFYATTALVCAVVAFSIGSSWTVAGTLGIGLMGVAASMNLSPAITAGAVISGAYFGDKASPLSDTVNLATATAGSQIYDHIRESLWTSIPSLAIAIILFAFMGTAGEFDATQLLSGIESKVTVSVWAFLPLLIVLVLSVLRFPPFIAIFIGALAGATVAVLQDPEAVVVFAAAPDLPYALALLKGAWAALATGYVANTGDSRARPDSDPRRYVEYDDHGVADHNRASLRCRGRACGLAQSSHRSSGQTCEVGRRPRRNHGGNRHRRKCDGLGSVHCRCSAQPTVRAGFL